MSTPSRSISASRRRATGLIRRSLSASARQARSAAAAGSKDLDAVPLLLTTQDQVRQTVAGVAAYGGSLDVILDDAEPAR